MNLYNEARGRIEEKVRAVENASMKVLDLRDMATRLVKNLQRKLERIISKLGHFKPAAH